jgi:hypothetical protein
MTSDYRLAEAAANARLKEFDADDPACLRRELALCRYLLEQAGQSKNHGLSVSLLSVIGRLAKEYDCQQARRNLFLHRATVMRLAAEMVAILVDEVRGLPNWEDRIDSLNRRLMLTIETAANTKKEIEEIEKPK